MEIGGKRTLTKGKKKGEMVYTRPDYITGKKRVQVTSGVKGGRGTKNPPRVKPTPSKGQIHSVQMKEKLTKAVNEANNRSATANRSTIRKDETIGQQRKRKKENEDIDKGFKTIALKAGGKIRSKEKDARKNKMSAPKGMKMSDSKKSKKEGPGIRIVDGITFDTRTKSMFPTEKRKKGGKVIKKNMSGNDLVQSCYD